jgi:bifunctional non-homologous end joining protein LigD
MSKGAKDLCFAAISSAALRELLRHGRGIQYVEHAEGHGDRLFAAACKLGLEGIVSKKLDAPYRSEPSRIWVKVKNPKSRLQRE